MRKALVIFILLCIFLVSVNAVRYVNYNFYEGILINGTLVKTSTPINKVNIIGFKCLDQGCNTLGDRIFNRGLNSGNNNSIQLSYPTNLLSDFGYGVYYFKDGYIPWESNPNWWGTNPNDPQGPYNVYLSKKDVCNSFINNLSVVNLNLSYIPVFVFFKAGINATVMPGINSGGVLGAVPSEVESSYKIKQLLKLRIFNSNNYLIEEKSKDIELNFGESKEMNFSFIPREAGRFNVTLSSRVIDSKCLNNKEINASAEISVIETEKPNYCYTLLNKIQIMPVSARAGDIIRISGNKVSNQFI